MNQDFKKAEKLDSIANKAGGFCTAPSEEDIAYTTLFLELCKKYKIHYASATPQQKAFVEEVTRVAWEKRIGKQNIRPAFSA